MYSPAPQDEALAAFRQHFPVALLKCKVSDDGMTMIYPLHKSKGIQYYLKVAKLVIMLHALPLTAEQEQFAIGDMVFEDNMLIRFEPSMIELPCY